MNDVRKITILI